MRVLQSGSVLDIINIERRGISAAAIGVEKLVLTTGMGMARAQGFPNLRVAMLTHSMGIMVGHHDPDAVDKWAQQAAGHVESILLGT